MMDFTTAWAFVQRYKHRTGYLITAVLIFAAGWQAGKVMSPYYAASPIVFEEKTGEGCPSGGGSPAELNALKEEGGGGVAGQQAAGPSLAPSAAAIGGAKPTAGVPQKLFVGSVNSDLYHHQSCSVVGRIKKENQLWFSSRREAEAAGYSPSECTRRVLGL